MVQMTFNTGMKLAERQHQETNLSRSRVQSGVGMGIWSQFRCRGISLVKPVSAKSAMGELALRDRPITAC
jgi:hypothetical protein